MPCRAPSATLFLVHTLDQTPPAFVNSTPALSSASGVQAEALVALSEAGSVTFSVLPQASLLPVTGSGRPVNHCRAHHCIGAVQVGVPPCPRPAASICSETVLESSARICWGVSMELCAACHCRYFSPEPASIPAQVTASSCLHSCLPPPDSLYFLQGTPAPSSEDLASGNFTAAAAHGTVSVPAAGQQVRAVLQGLAPLTAYEAYFVGQDNATSPNAMAQVLPPVTIAVSRPAAWVEGSWTLAIQAR